MIVGLPEKSYGEVNRANRAIPDPFERGQGLEVERPVEEEPGHFGRRPVVVAAIALSQALVSCNREHCNGSPLETQAPEPSWHRFGSAMW